MPIKLCKPGTRFKDWGVRGTYLGIEVDQSTFKANKREAEEFRETVQASIRTEIQRGDVKTFAWCADRYMDKRKAEKGHISRRDEEWINGLVGLFGERDIKTICQADFIEACKTIYPQAKASSKNRAIFRPLSAIVRYAAKNKWCYLAELEALEEPEVLTRALEERSDEDRLIGAAKATGNVEKHCLVLWLLRHGNRITESLGVNIEDCDTVRKKFRIHTPKNKKKQWWEFPMDEDIVPLVEQIMQDRTTGRLFPWDNRWQVYRWLTPLAKSVGVKFTPHVGRHTLGSRLENSGAGVRTIMNRLGHSSIKSALRYSSAPIEVVRAASERAKAHDSAPGKSPGIAA